MGETGPSKDRKRGHVVADQPIYHESLGERMQEGMAHAPYKVSENSLGARMGQGSGEGRPSPESLGERMGQGGGAPRRKSKRKGGY